MDESIYLDKVCIGNIWRYSNHWKAVDRLRPCGVQTFGKREDAISWIKSRAAESLAMIVLAAEKDLK